MFRRHPSTVLTSVPVSAHSAHSAEASGSPRRLVLAPDAWDRRRGDAGMATAEYAIATLAACGFAALLLTLLRSSEVRDLLYGIVQRALSIA
jgi:hypothetical protein